MRNLQTGWAIIGLYGLYIGWAQTRKAMIAEHVHNKCRATEEQPSQFATSALDPLQRERWKRCQAEGDRAVKVTITWDDPSEAADARIAS